MGTLKRVLHAGMLYCVSAVFFGIGGCHSGVTFMDNLAINARDNAGGQRRDIAQFDIQHPAIGERTMKPVVAHRIGADQRRAVAHLLHIQHRQCRMQAIACREIAHNKL